MSVIDLKIQVRVYKRFNRVDYEAANKTAELFIDNEALKRGSKAISACKIRELKQQGWTVEEIT